MSKGVILGQELNLEDIKQQIENVDNKLANYLPLSGGKMTGNIDMGIKKITNVANPSNLNDAVNLNSVRNEINKEISKLSGFTFSSLATISINSGSQEKIFNLSKLPSALIVDFTLSSGSGVIRLGMNASSSSPILDNVSGPISVKLFIPYYSVGSSGQGRYTLRSGNFSHTYQIGTNTVTLAREGTLTGTCRLTAVYY